MSFAELPSMKALLLAVLGAYFVAAIHSVLAFVNKRRALQRVSHFSLALGFVLHTATLIGDWVIDDRYPLLSLRETLCFLAWTLVAAYGVVVYRYGAQAFGVIALPLASLLILISIFIRTRPTQGAEEISLVSAKWLFPMHTTMLSFAYAAFFVVFVSSVMYLLQERELKLKTFSAIFHRLPSLTTVNDIATTAATIGLTLLTLGIVTGMLWSSARDGRFWHNDPKEVFAAVTWLLYVALIVYRSTAKWRGRRAAWLGVLGFVLVVFTFLGPRLMDSYHAFG
jgi:cytochrome c-type biogenesis protein CcsB